MKICYDREWLVCTKDTFDDAVANAECGDVGVFGFVEGL